MSRYDAGETLASIARTYDCSPPAISYVVSRSRARQPGPEPAPQPPGGSEPQLIKTAAADAVAAAPEIPPIPAMLVPHADAAPNGHDRPEANSARSNPVREHYLPRESNGSRSPAPVPAAQAANGKNGTSPPGEPNGEQRRTLHLSLGNPAQHNGGDHPAENRREPEAPPLAQPVPPPPVSIRAGNGQENGALNGASRMPASYPEHLRHNNAETSQRKNGGTFIDQELRARVGGDIDVFLAAFDAALGHDTQENRAALREATDRLLRAGARTRIELERLEARLPLPPRNDGHAGEMGWRGR